MNRYKENTLMNGNGPIADPETQTKELLRQESASFRESREKGLETK